MVIMEHTYGSIKAKNLLYFHPIPFLCKDIRISMYISSPSMSWSWFVLATRTLLHPLIWTHGSDRWQKRQKKYRMISHAENNRNTHGKFISLDRKSVEPGRRRANAGR